MNSINITNDDMVKYMINILSMNNNKKYNNNLTNLCYAFLTSINGNNHNSNKNRIAFYGSIIHEILNQIHKKPYKKINNINIVINLKNSYNTTSELYKFAGYKKISNLHSNKNIIETGKLTEIYKHFKFDIIITTINIDIKEFINELPYEFNKAYYLLNNINTSNNYNKEIIINKKDVQLNFGFVLQQLLHGMRFKINCSI